METSEKCESTEFNTSVAAVLSSLRSGDIMTYGEVALEAGFPQAARAVGQFLSRNEGFPWWRIVNAQGRLAPGHERKQAKLLRSEGIEVSGAHITKWARS